LSSSSAHDTTFGAAGFNLKFKVNNPTIEFDVPIIAAADDDDDAVATAAAAAATAATSAVPAAADTAAKEAAAIATGLQAEISRLQLLLITEQAAAAAAIATALANGRVFVPGDIVPRTPQEHQLQALHLQVMHLQQQLWLAASDAQYWAHRAYTAETINLDSPGQTPAPTNTSRMPPLHRHPGSARAPGT
jgi:hypothetical protein